MCCYKIVFIIFLIKYLQLISACDEKYCSPIVSNCRNECNCTIQNCSCCIDCFKCMHSDFGKCCDCIGLCPGLGDTKPGRYVPYYTEDLPAMSRLFETLTIEPYDEQWKTVVRPIGKITEIENQSFKANCTVIFLNQCVSLNKCRRSCKSVGASAYRWFHDACCQCSGPNCRNFEISQTSECRECPEID